MNSNSSESVDSFSIASRYALPYSVWAMIFQVFGKVARKQPSTFAEEVIVDGCFIHVVTTAEGQVKVLINPFYSKKDSLRRGIAMSYEHEGALTRRIHPLQAEQMSEAMREAARREVETVSAERQVIIDNRALMQLELGSLPEAYALAYEFPPSGWAEIDTTEIPCQFIPTKTHLPESGVTNTLPPDTRPPVSQATKAALGKGVTKSRYSSVKSTKPATIVRTQKKPASLPRSSMSPTTITPEESQTPSL